MPAGFVMRNAFTPTGKHDENKKKMTRTLTAVLSQRQRQMYKSVKLPKKIKTEVKRKQNSVAGIRRSKYRTKKRAISAYCGETPPATRAPPRQPMASRQPLLLWLVRTAGENLNSKSGVTIAAAPHKGKTKKKPAKRKNRGGGGAI